MNNIVLNNDDCKTQLKSLLETQLRASRKDDKKADSDSKKLLPFLINYLKSDKSNMEWTMERLRNVCYELADYNPSSKDDNIPVTVQIREVVNGYPGKRIVPFSEKTLNPDTLQEKSGSARTEDNVGTADDINATNFKFDSPVYLAPGEYSLVIITNTNQNIV